MNYRHFSEIYTDEKEFTREKLQFFFDKSFREGNENQLRNLYRTLRDLEFNCDSDIVFESVDISTICENITSAFDVFASNSGKNFIYCGNSTCHVYGNHRFIAKAFLNLLSNAYLYSTNTLVTVKTIENEHFVKIEVQSGGEFLFCSPEKKGLTFVRKVCNQSKGYFFIQTKQDSSTAIMMLKKSNIDSGTACEHYNFTGLLSNRLSPVYIEVFGMDYH